MNASYRLNTCKSRGSIVVATRQMATGARVRNAYPTWPSLGYSPAKVGLIPDVVKQVHIFLTKGLPVRDGDAFH